MKLQTEGRQTERKTWLDHLGFEGPLQPGTHPVGPDRRVPHWPGRR